MGMMGHQGEILGEIVMVEWTEAWTVVHPKDLEIHPCLEEEIIIHQAQETSAEAQGQIGWVGAQEEISSNPRATTPHRETIPHPLVNINPHAT